MKSKSLGLLYIFRGALKFLAVFFCFILFFLSVFFLSIVFAFSRRTAKRLIVSRVIRVFDSCLIRIMNIRITLNRMPPPPAGEKNGSFLVSNHLSYCDGFILGSLFPVIYVGKAELKRWPLIGLMSDFSGTLFIDRARKNHIAEYISTISEALRGGVNILFFPEGTSTCGDELLPFKPAFFEAAIESGSPIVPVSLVYRSIDGRVLTKENRDLVYWYADMTFFGHFFRLLCLRGIEVEVNVHPSLRGVSAEDNSVSRKHVCEAAYEAIAEDLLRK